jgi:hypothetical protein
MKTEEEKGGERRLTDELAYRHKYTSRTQHKTEVVFSFSLYAFIFLSMPMTIGNKSQPVVLCCVFFYITKVKRKRCNLRISMPECYPDIFS